MALMMGLFSNILYRMLIKPYISCLGLKYLDNRVLNHFFKTWIYTVVFINTNQQEFIEEFSYSVEMFCC